jgi:DNA repair protein RecO (recombination protein O)
MKSPNNTQGLILSRINYGESDRILTVLTKDFGKISLIAKGTRKEKSRLSGGIELFSLSEISFIEGKRGMGTLVGARLVKQYSTFFNDLAKIEFGYSCLKLINKYTTEDTDPEYFYIIRQLYEALDDEKLTLSAITVWWVLQLSNITGHAINVISTTDGSEFSNNDSYSFETEKAGFTSTPSGPLIADHIKYLRLALIKGPHMLAYVKSGSEIADKLAPFLLSFVEYQF